MADGPPSSADQGIELFVGAAAAPVVSISSRSPLTWPIVRMEVGPRADFALETEQLAFGRFDAQGANLLLDRIAAASY